MSVTLSAPAALWLLLALPLVWAAAAASRTNFNRRQRILQAVVRSLLLTAIAFAAARPVIARASSRQSIVFAVDVSHSIAGAAIESAAAKIDSLLSSLQPDHSRIIVFGKNAAPVADAAALRAYAAVDAAPETTSAVDRAGTDLEAALLAARGEVAPEHVPRIVLFSDGRPTAGDTDAALTRLAAERVPASVEPLAVRTIGDAWVEDLALPERVPAGGLIPVTVTVGSQRAGSGTIELRDGETPLGRTPVTFARGATSVTLDITLESRGAHTVTARLDAGDDPLTPNNVLSRTTWADPRARVLYVEGTPASARYLNAALTTSGFDVTVLPPARIPATPDALDAYDVVILSDVPRAALSDEAMNALADFVENRGGGLLVAGGEAVFGEGGRGGGYRRTAIERLTPVTFERRDEPEVALVIVLDRSWSMAGSSMELTKTAAQAAVDVLSDEQSIGILTFNDKFAWDVPLRNVGEHRAAIRKRIDAIGPGGHTLIYPAVEQAYLALKDAKARAKHVILLSDGRSYPGEYEALVAKMVEARITVSTVAVGPSSDPELLQNLARWGKGRAYVVADATQVPEIFVKEAKNAATPSFDEKSITPVVKTPAFLSALDLSRMPALRGRTATVLKDGALELLATEDKEPLLAFWPIGLGRTAVFASDVKDRWAANWIKWRGYGPFFTSIVRALQRQRPPALALDVVPGPVRGSSRSVAIAVEAREPSGLYRNLLNPIVHVRAGTGAPAPLRTRQVAPGRYEATIVADAGAPLTIDVAADDEEGAGVTSRTVLPDPAAEYRFAPPDEDLLRSIATATGGTWEPTADTLRTAVEDTRTERRPIWAALLALALVLWFVDLLLRRVRLFEPRAEDAA